LAKDVPARPAPTIKIDSFSNDYFAIAKLIILILSSGLFANNSLESSSTVKPFLLDHSQSDFNYGKSNKTFLFSYYFCFIISFRLN
jgi:hypothetical protein